MKNKEISISVKDVHKAFKLSSESRKSLKSLFVQGRGKKKKRIETLRGISLDIKKGEFFGIIGRNGSGKSTLLKILAGVYVPTKGSVYVDGKLTPFIELGVGFNPELSGRDNVYLNSALLGLGRSEVDQIYDDIVGFAELEDSMDKKLKNYSSGMQVRLAFSIAIRSMTDVLLIDEVLAVGDVNFQKKCIDVFRDLKSQGKTIIFVSHSMEYVREFCDRVAVIDEGIVAYCGNIEKGIDKYNKLNSDLEGMRISVENQAIDNESVHLGNGGAIIAKYSFYNHKHEESVSLSAGKEFTVKLEIDFKVAVKRPAVGIMFRQNQHDNLFGINNFYENVDFGGKAIGDKIEVMARGIMPLAPGAYYVSFTVTDAESAANYIELDMLNNICRINIEGKQCWGLINSGMRMEACTR